MIPFKHEIKLNEKESVSVEHYKDWILLKLNNQFQVGLEGEQVYEVILALMKAGRSKREYDRIMKG